ncbi:hypothetical protein [Psychrobacter nivimaris]
MDSNEQLNNASKSTGLRDYAITDGTLNLGFSKNLLVNTVSVD